MVVGQTNIDSATYEKLSDTIADLIKSSEAAAKNKALSAPFIAELLRIDLLNAAYSVTAIKYHKDEGYHDNCYIYCGFW